MDEHGWHVGRRAEKGAQSHALPSAAADRAHDNWHVHPTPLYNRMNQAALDVARTVGGVDILDQARVRELNLRAGDGMHCLRGVVCNGVLDALLRLVELGPQTQNQKRESSDNLD